MADWLRETHDTAVVPGRFFGDPGRIRVGLGIEPDLLRQALANLGDAIRRFRG
jgi:aspartate/methionine/tyrosine aminotransferase